MALTPRTIATIALIVAIVALILSSASLVLDLVPYVEIP